MKNIIENTLNSIQGMQRAEPSASLYCRIEKRILEQGTRIIPMKWGVSVAAGLVLLIGVNVGAMLYQSNKISSSNNIENIYSLMGQPQSNQLYTY